MMVQHLRAFVITGQKDFYVAEVCTEVVERSEMILEV